jgi:hypothetical protein
MQGDSIPSLFPVTKKQNATKEFDEETASQGKSWGMKRSMRHGQFGQADGRRYGISRSVEADRFAPMESSASRAPLAVAVRQLSLPRPVPIHDPSCRARRQRHRWPDRKGSIQHAAVASSWKKSQAEFQN